MSEATPELLDEAHDPKAFRREQIEMMYRQLPLMFTADAVAGAFLIFVLFNAETGLTTYLWYGFLVGTATIRFFIARHHQAKFIGEESMSMRWRFLVFSGGLGGFIWGNSWLLLPASPEFNQVIFVAVWLAGMQAGASSTMSIIKEMFIAYTSGASLVYFIYLIVLGADFSYLVMGAYVMYLGFIVPIAWRTGGSFNRTLVLQTNNALLKESLDTEARRLVQNQQELEEEKRRHQALQTEKAAADEKLRIAAEERLLLLDTVGEGIIGLDNRGNIAFINSTALGHLQLDESDVLGKSALRLISAAGNESVANVEAFLAINRSFQNAEPVQNMECDLLGKNDIKIPIRFSCAPIVKSDVVDGAVISFTDVSEQKDMEAMLVQAQKMEAIGRLTGGVAHDFNNLLTVILGNLQFLKRKIDGDESALNFVDKTMAAAKRGAELNNRLLSFSREQDLQTDLVEINSVLRDMEIFLDRMVGENVQLRMELLADESIVLTDQAQLENAMFNLTINAKDAMPDGGVLKVETHSVRLQKSYVRGDDSVGEGDFLEICVTDSGVGIKEEILEQIFEPFFTTKEKDSGTGLGLATVYGFLRQSGGNIIVDSKVGKWTTFKIYLPIAETVAIPRREKLQPANLPEPNSYSGKVLVVEDSTNVREVAVRALSEAGFDVLSAADGRQGLEAFESNPDLDVVFSDVIMPGGLTGIDMAEKMLEKSPNLPILLATGYTEKSMKDRMLAKSQAVFISKPYDTEDLPGLIHAMMSKQAS
ncbi:MAG: response regulator [Pseudomonadales bacterium]|nr:response regulator [Pseudomonadales bacterium]